MKVDTSNEPYISTKGLYKIFGNNPAMVMDQVDAGIEKQQLLDSTHHVLGVNNINLNIASHQIQVIMGLSGSGKSTLIRLLNRLIEPTQGSVFIAGQNIMSLSKKEVRKFRQNHMSMVFQRFALLPHKTVQENIVYGLTVRGDSIKMQKQQAQNWLHRVGLDGYENYYPAQLSGGMQQRVGLARALATDVGILLMDEAFSALDPLIRNEMQNILLTLQKELHKTIVFITHDLDEALILGDRIAVLRNGSIVQDATPQEIILQPVDDYVADFTKDVNRARVIQARSIMTPFVKHEHSQKVPASMVLEDVLQVMSNTPTIPVTVMAEQSKPIGIITIESLIKAIKRPKSSGTDIY